VTGSSMGNTMLLDQDSMLTIKSLQRKKKYREMTIKPLVFATFNPTFSVPKTGGLRVSIGAFTADQDVISPE